MVDIKHVRVYLILCVEDIDTQMFFQQCKEILYDPIMEEMYVQDWQIEIGGRKPDWLIDVQYRAGVTDNIARSVEEAFALFRRKFELQQVRYMLCLEI